MNGRQEVWRLKQRLDSTFKRAAQVGTDPELQSDFARYLVVLVSGYVEQAVSELILEHSRRHAAPSVQRFVEYRTRRLANINSTRLAELLGSFNPDWEADLEAFLVDERKDALNSIVGLRNSIAHGQSVGVTYTRVSEYYKEVQKVVERVADLCAPVRRARAAIPSGQM